LSGHAQNKECAVNDSAIRFDFDSDVPMKDVDATLRLALLTVECLHGEDRTRLETRHRLDHHGSRCVIDTRTDVGRTLATVFGGYVRREFGDEAVRVTRIGQVTPLGGVG
jgi:hypothetical protein